MPFNNHDGRELKGLVERPQRLSGRRNTKTDERHAKASTRPPPATARTRRSSRAYPAIRARAVRAGSPPGTRRGRVAESARGHEAVSHELPHVRHGDGQADRESLAQEPRTGDRELVTQLVDVAELPLRQADLHNAIERLQIRIVERHNQYRHGVEPDGRAEHGRPPYAVEQAGPSRQPARRRSGRGLAALHAIVRLHIVVTGRRQHRDDLIHGVLEIRRRDLQDFRLRGQQ